MRHPFPALPFAALVWLLAACGSSDADPTPTSSAPATGTASSGSPSTEPSPPTSPPTSASTSASTSPSTSTSAPPPASTSGTRPSTPRRPRGRRLSAAERATIAEALREGRRLTREGQHTEALTRFEAALAIDPGAWRLECETAFVAWRAEDPARADQHLARAVNGMPPGFVPEAQRVPTAMCLFNAGLIHQAAGRTEQARDLWEESVRLRPNTSVSARLAALPPRTDDAPAWQSLPATTSIDAMVAAMREDFCAHGLAGFEGGELEDCEEVTLRVRPVGEDPPGLEAYRVSGVFGVDTAGGEQTYEALVVRHGDVMHARVLGQAYNAGLAASNTQIDVDAGLEDVLPGGRSELVVRVSDWGGSVSSEGEEGGSSRRLIVCSTDTGALRCFSLHVADSYTYTEWDEAGEGETIEEGYCQELELADGRASFTRCPDFRGVAPPFIDGAHELGALFERGDIRWPDVWQSLEPVGS